MVRGQNDPVDVTLSHLDKELLDKLTALHEDERNGLTRDQGLWEGRDTGLRHQCGAARYGNVPGNATSFASTPSLVMWKLVTSPNSALITSSIGRRPFSRRLAREALPFPANHAKPWPSATL